MHFLDLAILTSYLLLMLGIGWHFRHTADASQTQHFLAGRKMRMFPIGISIMVTSFTAVNYVAIPGEVAAQGLYVILSFLVFFIAAVPIARIWMPFFHKLQAHTVYEFLEQRFSRRVRLQASSLFLAWRILWMALALFASGKILAAFSGFSPTALIFICGVVATVYTCLGGMKAVMWTDVVQFCVLIASIVVLTAYAVINAPTAPFAILLDAGRFKPYCPLDGKFFSLDPTIRMTFFSVLLGTFVTFMTRYGADQVVMQRYFTAKNLAQAQKGIWLNAGLSCLALLILTCLGLALASGAPQNADMQSGFALAQMVRLSREMPPGVAGLLIAGILAATMSSIDSGLNACANTLTTDFRCKGKPAYQVIVLGAVITVIALWLLPEINKYQSIFAIINRFVNGIGSPLLAIVILGMFAPRFPEKAMFWGTAIGIAASIFLTVAVSRLALHHYATANLIMTFAACFALRCLSWRKAE